MNKKNRFRPTQTIDRLTAIHDFMMAYQAEKKLPPSIAELVKQRLVSSSSVASKCFERMEELGMITWNRKISRGAVALPLKNKKGTLS